MKGPGRFASALLLSILVAAGPAEAQAPPPAAPAAPTLPDKAVLAKLLWSTMAAIDHANRTADYSVLRALGTPSFQAANRETALSGIFAWARNQNLDLSATLMYEPVFEFPPAVQNGFLRMRGAFRMRPTGVEFDLLYGWSDGWRIEGVAIRPVTTVVPATRP